MRTSIASLLIAAAALTALSGCSDREISVNKAYSELSALPEMSVHKAYGPELPITSTDILDSVTVVAAFNLDARKVKAAGDAMYRILDKLPMERMVIGANNQLVAGFVYAEPVATDRNEVIFVSASGYNGVVCAIHGFADDATVESIRQAPLTMQGPSMDIVLEDTANLRVNLFNITGPQ